MTGKRALRILYSPYRAVAVAAAKAEFAKKLGECVDSINAEQAILLRRYGRYASAHGGCVDMGPVGPQARDAAFRWAADAAIAAATAAGCCYEAAALLSAEITRQEISGGEA